MTELTHLPNSTKNSDLASPELFIGVLALQGDYDAHAHALIECGATPSLVRTAADLIQPSVKPHGSAKSGAPGLLDGLIIPGGESTTMLRFLTGSDAREDFFQNLESLRPSQTGFRNLRRGDSAGPGSSQSLSAQLRSTRYRGRTKRLRSPARFGYPADLQTTLPEWQTSGNLETVFIRAPRILEIGTGVEVLVQRDGFPVLIREGHLMAATFHPELSSDRRVHRLFVESVRASAHVKRS